MSKQLNEDIISANKVLFHRYLNIIKATDDAKLDKEYYINFCEKALNVEMTVDKHSRWLGFIQGVLYMAGLIAIGEERDASRERFQKVYRDHGIIQETVSVDDETKLAQIQIIKIPIPLEKTNQVPMSILGVKNVNRIGEFFYAAAVFKDTDIERINDEMDPLEKQSIYIATKRKNVYSQIKEFGLHNFINKEYIAPDIDDVLRKVRAFAFNEYGIGRPVSKQ